MRYDICTRYERFYDTFHPNHKIVSGAFSLDSDPSYNHNVPAETSATGDLALPKCYFATAVAG